MQIKYVGLLGLLLAGTIWAGPMDDKRFVVKYIPDNSSNAVEEKAFKSEIHFLEDKVMDITFEKQGFQPGTYQAADAGRFVSWNAVQKSESAGTLTWTGVTRGKNKIEGTVVVTPKGGGTIKYLFRGKRLIDKS